MSETISQFWQRIGFKPGGKSGGRVSDDDVNQNALDAEAREFRVLRDRSITYRNRRGELVTVAPGEPGYIEARSELSMPQLSELNRLNEENMQRAIDIGQTAAMRSFADDRDTISSPVRDSPSVFDVARTPISMQDPEDFEFGESLTDLGVQQQRDVEADVASIQSVKAEDESFRIFKRLEQAQSLLDKSKRARSRLNPEAVKTIKRKYSYDPEDKGIPYYDVSAAEPATDIETLRESNLLERRQMEVDRLQELLDNIRPQILLEEQRLDPSKARMNLNQYLTNITAAENALRSDINVIENAIQESRASPVAFVDTEKERYDFRQQMYRDLAEKRRELRNLSKQRSTYEQQRSALPDTLPLQPSEIEEISQMSETQPRLREGMQYDNAQGALDESDTQSSMSDDEFLSQSMLTDLNEDSGMSRREPTDAQMNRRMKMAEYDMFGPGRSEVIRGPGFMSDKDGVANKENEDTGASPLMP